MPIALSHKISDAVTMRIDKDQAGFSVIEIEFKFIRYRLTIDDMRNGEKLSGLLSLILRSREKGEIDDGRLPSFYKSKEVS